MKINEITEAPGILGQLVKGAKAAVQGYTQSRDVRVNAQAIAQMSQVAARAWGKMKQNLERINDYKPLTPSMLNKQLRDWIDDNLLGSYSLDNGGVDLNRTVGAQMPIIINKPGQAVKSFQEILTVASKIALDPTAKGGGGNGGIDPNRQDVCPKNPTTVKGDSIFVCGQEVKKGENGYDELAGKLGIK